MSHNTKKINNLKPDSSSKYDIDVLDISDVNAASISDGQTFVWNSTNEEWVGADPDVSYSNEFMLIGEGASSAYSNANLTLSTSDPIGFYGPNVVNNITSSSLSGGGTDWYDKITLPEGKYIIEAHIDFTLSASGYIEFQIAKNGTGITESLAAAGYGSYSPGWGACYSKCTVSLSNNDYIEVLITGSSNLSTVANQGNKPAEYNQLFIRKI